MSTVVASQVHKIFISVSTCIYIYRYTYIHIYIQCVRKLMVQTLTEGYKYPK